MFDRQKKVVTDGFTSNTDTKNASVPKGFVLGPFLFLFFINGICDDLVNHIRLFANDTSLHDIIDDETTNVKLNNQCLRAYCSVVKKCFVESNAK